MGWCLPFCSYSSEQRAFLCLGRRAAILLWEQKQGSRGISHVESSMTLFLRTHASLRDKLVLAPDSLHSAALREATGQEIWGLLRCGSNTGLQRALCPCCWPQLCSCCATGLRVSYWSPTNSEPWLSPGGDRDCSVEGKRNDFFVGRVLGKSLESCCRKRGCIPAGSLCPVQLLCK